MSSLAALSILALGRPAFAHDPPSRALARITEHLRLHPNDASALRHRARLYINDGRYRQALTDVERALRSEPEQRDSVFLRAQVLEGLGREREAEAVLDGLVDRGPDYGASLLRSELRSARGERELALADIERALSIHISVEAALQHVRLLRELGRLREAVAAARHALRALGGAVLVRLSLIEVLSECGDLDDALKEVRHARAMARVTTRWDLREAEILDAMGERPGAERLRLLVLDEVQARRRRLGRSADWLDEARVLRALGRDVEAAAASARAHHHAHRHALHRRASRRSDSSRGVRP